MNADRKRCEMIIEIANGAISILATVMRLGIFLKILEIFIKR